MPLPEAIVTTVLAVLDFHSRFFTMLDTLKRADECLLLIFIPFKIDSDAIIT